MNKPSSPEPQHDDPAKRSSGGSAPATGGEPGALMRAFDWMQELLAQAPAAMGLLSGPEHRWNYVNSYCVRMTGRESPADFIGKTLRESVPEVERQGCIELLDRVYLTGRPYAAREMKAILNRGASGQPEEAYFDYVYQPIRNAAGDVEGILVHAVEVTDRVVARRLMEQKEERLLLAQSAAQIGTWEWDPASGASVLSPELHRMFGTDPGDPQHKAVWEARVHRDDWQTVVTRMRDGSRSGALEFEYRYLHPELGTRWFYCKGARLRGNSCFFGVVQDITERKRAEQALRESEQRLWMITDAAPVMVWMSGTDKLCHYFNRSWLEFVGRTLEQERGNGWAENVHPDDLERCMEVYVSAFDAQQPFEMEYRLRHHSGEYRWIFDHGVPRYGPDGSFEGYVGGCLDVHQQKMAEAAQRHLAAIVESSDDAIVSKTLKGVVTSWNPAAERIFGYTAQEMIGRSITTIIPPELLDDESMILSTIGRGQRIEHFETVRMTKDGQRIDVSLTISPVKDEAGRIIGAAKIARDITQQKKAQRALRTTEKLASVGRLAATIAHEINNPLEAVTNLVYLAKHAAVREEVRGFLDAAEQELDRVGELTKQTLGFYRETSGARAMTVGSTIQALMPIFASRARNKGVRIRLEIRQHAEIVAFPGEIRQLVANLLANGIDAIDSGGEVRIRVSGASEWRGPQRRGVRLTIADTGSGIQAAIRHRLYEPFFTTKQEIGTGLGLWVCKNIVDKHAGSIRMRSSNAPGKSGTVFSVFLPVAAQAASETEDLRRAG